jgi:hypothetical protein
LKTLAPAGIERSETLVSNTNSDFGLDLGLVLPVSVQASDGVLALSVNRPEAVFRAIETGTRPSGRFQGAGGTTSPMAARALTIGS